MLCEDYGGRVELAKAYYQGLTDSVKKHLGGNGVIASMEHCNDFMFLGTHSVCLGRVGTCARVIDQVLWALLSHMLLLLKKMMISVCLLHLQV